MIEPEPHILESSWCKQLVTQQQGPWYWQYTRRTLEISQRRGIPVLTQICNKILRDRTWPRDWTQSLIIPLPKKGKLKECKNYRTISLTSHPSKVMLRITLNRLQPKVEEILSEEQAGFRRGRSITQQIFNIRVITEKYLHHKVKHFSCFIDFKKAFDRVWHEALWASMHHYQMPKDLIEVISTLDADSTGTVLTVANSADKSSARQEYVKGAFSHPHYSNCFWRESCKMLWMTP